MGERRGRRVSEAAILATALLVTPAARADEVDELRDRVEAQDALIRQQTEALERQSREMQRMGDRLRMVEDEQLAARHQAAASVDGAPPHVPGSGFRTGENEWGELNMRLYTYVRYLNQKGLDETYTDSFGRTSRIDERQDIFLNKVNLTFYGWLMDPKFRYQLYAWTANTSQGLGAQVVLAGYLGYRFNEHFQLYGGTGALPGTRTTSGSFPFWLGVDQRLIADEFFRPSYTFGVWAEGEIVDDLEYQVMLGNNLSGLGVDAGQLDAGLNTVSAALAWMPLGDYGKGFGDFEEHPEPVARVALHFTRSDEDFQGQPDSEDFENVQIRLSDGNVIFRPGLFGPGIWIQDARYQMLAVDAGIKYRGYSLEGEYYYRWVDGFRGPNTGLLDFDKLEDQGFQLQASTMVIPEKLQLYVSGSKIFGEYGDPWDARLGVNWFPFESKAVRWNTEVIYVDKSPVGGLSLPYSVGDEGPIFHTNLEVFF